MSGQLKNIESQLASLGRNEGQFPNTKKLERVKGQATQFIEDHHATMDIGAFQRAVDVVLNATDKIEDNQTRPRERRL